MALSTTGYTASGAGTTADNGNYVPVVGAYATYNGATQYTNGTYFLAFGVGGYWYMNSAVNAGGTALYDVSGGSATTCPLTGWSTASGTAPAPTFADMSSGGGGGGTTARRRPPIFF